MLVDDRYLALLQDRSVLPAEIGGIFTLMLAYSLASKAGAKAGSTAAKHTKWGLKPE